MAATKHAELAQAFVVSGGAPATLPRAFPASNLPKPVELRGSSSDTTTEAGSKVLPAFVLGAAAIAAGGRRKASRALRRRAGQPQLSEVATWTGLTPGKEYRLQTMTVDSVAADTTTIRSLDWDRDRFDIEFALERGTTYNSYVIKGSEKTAIVDTSHEKFEELFFGALDKEVDYSSVDYLIVSHTEPDHSGLIFRVLEKAAAAGNEKLTVVGSKVCIQFLENLCFTPFKKQIVANGHKIDLGGGHELEFVVAPNLHWPDTIFTFDHGTGLLYTCDAFGMHYCSEDVHDAEGVKDLLPHYALYYDCLMKPNAKSVLTALKKTAGFDFHTIATGHGPMLVDNTKEWVEQYRSWSTKATEKSGPAVAIFWVSNFGQSERLSQLFAHGLTSTSVSVEMQDLNAIDAFEITECVARNDIIVVTSPPQGTDARGALGSIVAAMAEDVRARVLALGEEIRALKASLKDQGLRSAAVNGHAEVQALVAKLRELKAQLPEGDELSDRAFFERQRKEQEERERQRGLRVEEERRLLQSTERSVKMPLVQRKIFHLFQFAGAGDSFHYEPPPRLNVEQTGFGGGENPCPAVYVTEKWDGTTMQATSSAIFRRQEIVGKKRSKDPSHRYELKLVAWRDDAAAGSRWRGFDFVEADKRVAEALEPYLHRFEALDEGLCVYFECVHSHINATYCHVEGFADIRVFDFSCAGSFLPFDESIELARRFGLPLVGWERRERLAVAELWAELEAAKARSYGTVEAPLEGFVVREAGGDRIAKARVENLKAGSSGVLCGEAAAGTCPTQQEGGTTQGLLRTAADEGGRRPHSAEGVTAVELAACHSESWLSLGHLEAVGLLPSGWSGTSHLAISVPWQG